MSLLVLPFRVLRRFQVERCAQTAAALSFATLLGLVPMVAVGAAILSSLPLAESLGAAIQKFLLANLLPEKAGGIVAKYMGQFATKAQRLTWLGVGGLALTAILQMLTIEHAFNSIWSVKEKRPIWRRLLMNGLVLLVGPIVFGGSIVATTYIASVSLGLVPEWQAATASVLRGLSFGFVAVAFALLYWKVPNRPVLREHALLGGALAAAGFAGLQWLFATYISGFAGYRLVYGAFAAVPVFLLWLHLSWSVILLGALTTAELGLAATPGRKRRPF
jgi:membrane protein